MLSIVIPVRDWPADRIAACVQSFLRLKSRTVDEIVVVDYGSSRPIQPPTADRRVRVIRTIAQRWNPAEATNIGVAASRNRIVAKVDADIVAAAEVGPQLDAAVDRCELNGGIVAVPTTDLPQGIDAMAALASATDELASRGRLRPRSGCGGLCVFPVDLWDDVGGFDPGAGKEADADFADRVRRSGNKLWWAPPDAFRVFHIWHAPVHEADSLDDAGAENRQDRSGGGILRPIVLSAEGAADGVQAPRIVNRPRPLVTVSIVSRAREGQTWMLAAAIRGFAGQINNDFEILIANRGPASELSTRLRRETGVSGGAIAVRVVDIGEEAPPAARNILTDEAHGRYICLADNDAIPLPGRLGDHLRCFENDAGIHGSHGGWITVDQLNNTLRFNAGGNSTVEALLGDPSAIIAPGASFYRSDVMRAIRYDEAAGAADHDFALRMSAMGCRVLHTGSYVTVRRSRGATDDAERSATKSSGQDPIREAIGNFAPARIEQASAAAVSCVNPPTVEQVAELFARCSGLVTGSSEGVSSVKRHPKTKPLVSIVIPCFNYGRFVKEAVASAKAQTLDGVEVIVVDGGSTDGDTRRIVASLEDEAVRVFLRRGRHRAGSNRNYGIGRARGKYICCLDADDKLAPTYVEKAVFLMEHFGYDVVSSSVQKFGQDTTRYGVAEAVDLQVLLKHNQMATSAVFRKALWKAAGGYHDHGDGSAATHVHEDWEFWVRLAANGARFFNIERDHLFLYRIHDTPSISRRDGIRSLDWQRDRIREMNAAVIGDEAIERSMALRRKELRARNPLVNLAGRAPEERKSILIALPWMVLGGAERLLSKVVKRLGKDGWDASIVTTLAPNTGDGDSEPWFAAATDRIFHLPKFLAEDRWNDFLDYLIGSRGIRRLLIAGSAYVYEQLPDLKAKYPQLKVLDLLFNTAGHTPNNRKFAEFIDGNIVENSEVREWLMSRGEQDKRIALIPSGVDLSATTDLAARSVRASIGARPDDVVVGFCGRWSPEKNPIAFIEMAERLIDNAGIHFVMTGTGQLADDVSRRLAAAAGLARRFHLLGSVPAIEPVLAALDILVLPSLVDGRPVVVLEALAAGVAVVASEVGGVPELIVPGRNGELCPPGDIDAFVQAVAALAADRQKLARYKAEARAFAEQHLDEELMLKRYVEVLTSGDCAGGAATPAGAIERRRFGQYSRGRGGHGRSPKSNGAFVHGERHSP
jgi:glycosyltransferase involved in cell wall biosynthesis